MDGITFNEEEVMQNILLHLTDWSWVVAVAAVCVAVHAAMHLLGW